MKSKKERKTKRPKPDGDEEAAPAAAAAAAGGTTTTTTAAASSGKSTVEPAARGVYDEEIPYEAATAASAAVAVAVADPASLPPAEKKRRKRKRKRAGKDRQAEADRDQETDDDDGDRRLGGEKGRKDASRSNQTEGKDADRPRSGKKRRDDHGEDDRQGEDEPDDEVARTVYVEGIPYDASEAQVRDFFRGLDLASLRLPTWQDSGRLRGYGHATFRSLQDARAAVREYSGLTLAPPGSSSSSRYLRIQPARPPKSGQAIADPASHSSFSPEPSRTILLKNLSYDASEDDVRRVMEDHGEIAEGGIRVARHNRTRNSKGFAFVEYRSLEGAARAYRAAAAADSPPGGIVICGRACAADYDHGTVQKSFRTHTGRLWQKQYGGKQ